MLGLRFGVSCCLFLVLAINTAGAQKSDRYTVSVANAKASNDESIVAFEIHVTAGAIKSVSDLPVGWYFTIDNDASWQTTVKANSMVGAASLRPDELKNLKFVIQKNEFGDLKFNLSGAVFVTRDFSKSRERPVSMSDFSLSPNR